MMEPIRMVVVTGPTASGKTDVAFEVARRLGSEIVSLDSMKLYRGMDVGTAKPTPQERGEIPYRLVDILDPWESFSVAQFVERADAEIARIAGKSKPPHSLSPPPPRGEGEDAGKMPALPGGRVPIVEGGTVLYLKGLLEGLFEGPSADWEFRERLEERARVEGAPALHRELAEGDPEAAARIHPNDLRRIVRGLEVRHRTGRPISELQQQAGRRRERYDPLLIGLRMDRERLYRRINRRVKEMVENGLVEEVKRLASHPKGIGRVASQGLGYKEILAHLNGEYDLEEAVMWIAKRTRHFAKHQMSWLRRFPDLQWIDVEEETSPAEVTEKIVEKL